MSVSEHDEPTLDAERWSALKRPTPRWFQDCPLGIFVHWGPLMAAVTMTTIPSILLVVFLQKQLEKGVTLGAFGGR